MKNKKFIICSFADRNPSAGTDDEQRTDVEDISVSPVAENRLLQAVRANYLKLSKFKTMIKEVQRGKTTTETIDFTLETCCVCGIPFFMPTYHYKRLVANKGESFYCPNGHSMSFTGPTEAQKLKEKLEALQKQKDQEHDDLQNKWLDALNEKYKVEKQLKRLHKGVCPCCNRSFVNLQRHMKNQHPDKMIK